MGVIVSKLPTNIWAWIGVAGLFLAVIIGAFVLFVEAPPPNRDVIATGSRDGDYYRYAKQYAELLRKDGITLEILETHGSVENVRLLDDANSDVELAFVQSGIVDPAKSPKLLSLCSLYPEPLWIFYKGEGSIDRFSQLEGKRVAIGQEGSGTRAAVQILFDASAIDITRPEFVALNSKDAADALQNNEIDAAIFVAGVDAEHVRRLTTDPTIKLANLAHSEAYSRRYRHMSTQIVPEGLLDLKTNIPPTEVKLIAPMATLVAHRSLHPALVAIILKAAVKVHRNGTLFSKVGEFPSLAYTDLPVSDDAERFFRHGPPVLQRILPFWVASLIDRMKLMLIPLIMILTPLMRAAPPIVRWQTRRKIYLWYEQLRLIDQSAIHGMTRAEAVTSLESLHKLEVQIAHVGVPLSYMEEYYQLRLHLNLVRKRVETIVESLPAKESFDSV